MKLSIIIPAYNAARTIESCLDSIVSQSFDNYEVMVIDDGSDDETLSVCKKMADKHKQIIPLHQSRAGVSMARNLGLEHASGEYIMFVDADDTLVNDCLSKIFEFVDKFVGEADMALFGMNAVSINGRKSILASFDYAEISDTKDFFRTFSSNSLAFGVTWGRLFLRKTIVDNNIRFKSEYRRCQDTIFILDYAPICKKILTIPVMGYDYIHNINGTTLRFLEDIAITCADGVRKASIDYFVNHCGETDALQRINRRYAFDYLYNIYPLYRLRGIKNRYYWLKRYWAAAEACYPEFSHEYNTGIPKIIGFLGRRSKSLTHLFLISLFSIEKLKHSLKK